MTATKLRYLQSCLLVLNKVVLAHVLGHEGRMFVHTELGMYCFLETNSFFTMTEKKLPFASQVAAPY